MAKRLLAALLALEVLGLVWNLFGGSRAVFAETEQGFGNPLMGFAPDADSEQLPADVTLVYLDITWREWEPQPGVFDRETVAADNQLDRWRAEGKHVVLRFVCDVPGEQPHRDIPDWLYEECGGQNYDTEYGKGCSPRYEDERMIRYHAQAVQALGDWLGGDGFVAYIELGSLGHWGEWHVNTDEGVEPLPGAAVRERYVLPWLAAFPHARLLMRRPFAIAAEKGLGVYNDMTGHPADTAEWLDWLAMGGSYDQTGEPDALVPMPEVWRTAPVGGEFTSSLPMEEMLGAQLDRTLTLLNLSHATFLGPKAPKEGAPGREAVLSALGYRLGVRRAALSAAWGGTRLTLRWHNAGAAPLYWDWPVMVYVYDRAGTLVESARMNMALSALGPGDTLETSVRLATPGLARRDRNGCTVTVGILDPMTGRPAVRLTTGEQDAQGCMVVF